MSFKNQCNTNIPGDLHSFLVIWVRKLHTDTVATIYSVNPPSVFEISSQDLFRAAMAFRYLL